MDKHPSRTAADLAHALPHVLRQAVPSQCRQYELSSAHVPEVRLFCCEQTVEVALLEMSTDSGLRDEGRYIVDNGKSDRTPEALKELPQVDF